MADERLGLNARVGVLVTRKVSSMWSVYVTIVFVLGWIVLATSGPLRHSDPYPFPFLLFLGNLVQLMLVFVILVGQGVVGRTADQRAEQTFQDAEAILHEVTQLHSHLREQDKILNNGTELVLSEAHPWLKERTTIKPPTVREQYVGLNGRIAATITKGASTMWAFYAATVFQIRMDRARGTRDHQVRSLPLRFPSLHFEPAPARIHVRDHGRAGRPRPQRRTALAADLLRR